jgi:hypothetical protein
MDATDIVIAFLRLQISWLPESILLISCLPEATLQNVVPRGQTVDSVSVAQSSYHSEAEEE